MFAKPSILNRFSATFRAVLVIATVWSIGAASWAGAAELRLRKECQAEGPVVTFGDVAEILSNDPKQVDALAAIELFPAPAATRPRYLRLREIQDLLLLRGINLTEHRFSGSSQVTIHGGTQPVAEPKKMRPLSASNIARANRRVREPILKYLDEHVSDEQPWMVDFKLEKSRVRLLAGGTHPIVVTGGAAPWTGRQQFTVTVDTPDEPILFSLEAEVTLPPAVVVAVRSLRSGALILPSDVRLQRKDSTDDEESGFRSIDEVVGKETTRSVGKGRALLQTMVRSPLLVRRGDVVTVCARASGICVRTTARARDAGSLGDLIAVESLLNRETYLAQVSNTREVEVMARAVKANSPAIAREKPRAIRKDPRGATSRRREQGPILLQGMQTDVSMHTVDDSVVLNKRMQRN